MLFGVEIQYEEFLVSFSYDESIVVVKFNSVDEFELIICWAIKLLVELSFLNLGQDVVDVINFTNLKLLKVFVIKSHKAAIKAEFDKAEMHSFDKDIG